MSNYSTLDRYDGLGNPLTPPDTYPAGWIIIAAVLAVIALWVPCMVLALIGAVVLGVRAIVVDRIKAGERRRHEADTP